MFRHAVFWLLIALATTGCDRISGAADQKISDAEAIGYACRVSLKKPEDCMKENETQSTTSVLAGWKSADKDIADKTLDPSMGQNAATAAETAVAAAASAAHATSAASAPADAQSSDKGRVKSPDKATEEAKTSEKKPAKSH